jgi:phospholipid/cholesterol/gamma-HCH transport system substrate-binding protein
MDGAHRIMNSLVETVLGAVVVLGGLLLLLFAYNTAQLRTTEGYSLQVLFFKVGGLQEGNEVRVGGVKVGSVSRVHLDPETYDAVVSISLDPGLRLPVDTVAAIAADGIFGGKYMQLEPGQEKEVLKPGETIEQVRDAASLEDLIGEAIF